MNYYFTKSRWYGPICVKTYGKDHFNKGNSPVDYYLSLPSGPSLISEFAGMVKEEGKDFIFRPLSEFFKGNYSNVCDLCRKEYSGSDKLWFICPDCCNQQTAVPIEEYYIQKSWGVI